MKNIMGQRIKKIEDLLKRETTICMIAAKTEQGITWNGVTYPDEKAIHKAVKDTLGKYQRVPLIIIERGVK